MELKKINTFVHVAECLNFTTAAHKLFLTQSAVSHQIKQLEDELEIALFDRSEKRIQLTEAGQEFLPFGLKLLREAEIGKQRLLDLQNIRTGKLRIGVNFSFSNLLMNSMVNFIQDFPGVDLIVIYKTVNELLEMVQRREIDFALSYKPLEEIDNIQCQDLFTTSLSVIAHVSHPWSSHASISLEALAQMPMVLPSRGLHARNMLDKLLNANQIQLHPQVELNEASILIHLVGTGKWLTILSDSTIQGNPDFKAIPITNCKEEMQAALIWAKDGYRKFSVKTFMQRLTQENPH